MLSKQTLDVFYIAIFGAIAQMEIRMLENWNFTDPVANSTIPPINRQESARNLIVISIDRQNCTGLLFDVKKDLLNMASPAKCDRNDFNSAGAAPRKSFNPCAHIYRSGRTGIFTLCHKREEFSALSDAPAEFIPVLNHFLYYSHYRPPSHVESAIKALH